MKTMKKIITALTITGLLFLSISCSSDDNTPVPPVPPIPPVPTFTELLVGKWKVQESGEYIDGKMVPETIDDCEAKGSIEFLADFNFLDISFEEYPAGSCTSHTYKGTWSIQDDNITSTYIFENDPPKEEDIDTMKIIKLTATELHVESKGEYTENGETITYHSYGKLIRL